MERRVFDLMEVKERLYESLSELTQGPMDFELFYNLVWNGYITIPSLVDMEFDLDKIKLHIQKFSSSSNKPATTKQLSFLSTLIGKIVENEEKIRDGVRFLSLPHNFFERTRQEILSSKERDLSLSEAYRCLAKAKSLVDITPVNFYRCNIDSEKKALSILNFLDTSILREKTFHCLEQAVEVKDIEKISFEYKSLSYEEMKFHSLGSDGKMINWYLRKSSLDTSPISTDIGDIKITYIIWDMGFSKKIKDPLENSSGYKIVGVADVKLHLTI